VSYRTTKPKERKNMRINSELAFIRLNTRNSLPDAFDLATRFLSVEQINEKDVSFEFSKILFVAVSLIVASEKVNATFKDMLDYLVDPAWDATKQMLCHPFNRMSEFVGDIQNECEPTVFDWAYRFQKTISDLQTERQAIDLVNKCHCHWTIALEEHNKSCNEKLKGQNSSMDKLDAMIGLASVKAAVRDLVMLANYDARRKEEGLPSHDAGSLHLVFTGNPGTGKTVVAKLIAEIYAENKLLKKGHLIEATRSDLVGGYIGQTAIKTTELINSALDGVLFIDEAYTLLQGLHNEYGQEAIDTLITNLENQRNRFAVIVAGYPDDMKTFIAANAGLKSRFPIIINFDDYNADELFQILQKFLSDNEYYFDSHVDVILRERMNQMYLQRDKTFANARDVRNFFFKLLKNHAKRLHSMPRGVDLQRILLEDIPNA